MAIRHEAPKQKIPEIHFKPEGYLSSGDDEFLDEILGKLTQAGLDSSNLVFSGFDGTAIARGEEMPRYPYVFVMDEGGWREANRRIIENPAIYAEGWSTPCIAVYDKSQLAEAYYGVASQDREDLDSRIELTDVVVGRNLSELPSGRVVEEAIVHKDFPDASPTDALLGLVFLDK